MSEPSSGASEVPQEVRLFPLPNLVFYPRAVQPLHIFEPRYRQMTAAALAGDQFITMVLLRDGWEADYEGRPAVHAVACVGKVLASQRLPDGRYDLLLHGQARVRILEEVAADTLYRVARVQPLVEHEPDAATARKLIAELGQAAAAWLWSLGQDTELPAKITPLGPPLGVVCDLLAFQLPFPAALKQELLEELDAERRAVRMRDHMLTHGIPQHEPTDRPFPPPFSPN